MLYLLHSTSEKNMLPLTVSMFGIHHPQEPINRPSGLPFWQWFYTVKGEGELIVDGKKYVLTENQVFLIAQGADHNYHALTDEWVTDFIGFGGEICEPLLRHLHIEESGIYQLSDGDIFLQYLQQMQDIHASDQKAKDKELSYSTACYRFLCEIAGGIHKIGPADTDTENSYVSKAIRYMEDHYSENFSLDELAEHVGLSKSYLCHLFHREMQVSIVNHLQMIRLIRARFLLEHYPELRIGQIALSCGFETPSYFSKVFRRKFGVTPEEYRIGKRE